MSVTLPRRTFTTEEFRGMIEAGVFRKNDRLELVDGEIIEMTPIGIRHASCVRRLIQLLKPLGDAAVLDVQNPLGISDENDFYPDVVLLRPRPDAYGGVVPHASDALLVIEVADSSLAFDRTIKLPRYAAAGASELWVVDLGGRRVWVHRKPLEGDYGEVFEAGPGDALPVPGCALELRVNDFLDSGPAR